MPLESETASIPYADPPEVVKVRVRRGTARATLPP